MFPADGAFSSAPSEIPDNIVQIWAITPRKGQWRDLFDKNDTSGNIEAAFLFEWLKTLARMKEKIVTKQRKQH